MGSASVEVIAWLYNLKGAGWLCYLILGKVNFVSLHFKKKFWKGIFVLKVLTNEKRGGLTVVSFDGFPFKLFLLRFSYKSMQTPSYKRTETNQQTLFLSFAINNCFPTSDEKLLAIFELILWDFYHCKTTIR
jgi:hypothetical protein